MCDGRLPACECTVREYAFLTKMSIGVDTGGTFTDLVLLRPDGSIRTAKRPSTPGDFSAGVMDVVAEAEHGDASLLARAGYFYHGTTVATNAMITGSGAKIGFLPTAGPRHALPMMRLLRRPAGRPGARPQQDS